GAPARGRDDGGAVRGVRDFPEDRPQDLSAVPADRRAGPYRSQSPAAAASESAADGRGENDRQDQARVSQLGRAEDPGATAAALARGSLPRDQHRACGPRPPWAGDAAGPPITQAPPGPPALLARGPQSPLVRRL